MRNIKLTHFSQILCRNKEINIILPDEVKEDTKVLLLLHGYCGDHNDWVNLGNAYYEAMKYNMAFVMPSAENSYYINICDGDRFYDYVNNEVINEVEKLIGNNLDWYIAGLSMGGYGALLYGLTNNKYKAIGAFSAPCDLITRIKKDPHHNFNVIFNNLDVKKVDLYNHINNANKFIYLYCGSSDSFYNDNIKFYNSLKENNASVIMDSDTRGHTWDLWRDALKRYLELINN